MNVYRCWLSDPTVPASSVRRDILAQDIADLGDYVLDMGLRVQRIEQHWDVTVYNSTISREEELPF